MLLVSTGGPCFATQRSTRTRTDHAGAAEVHHPKRRGIVGHQAAHVAKAFRDHRRGPDQRAAGIGTVAAIGRALRGSAVWMFTGQSTCAGIVLNPSIAPSPHRSALFFKPRTTQASEERARIVRA